MSTHDDAPRSESPTGSPRSASMSMQAAASMMAGLQRESSRGSQPRSSPQSGRRRSILLNLQMNDPSIPSPGEMVASEHSAQPSVSPSPRFLSGSPPMTADPHHHRAPSLGELHQELEAEQEAHVNRLLQMIRQQQLDLQRLQASNPQNQNQGQPADGGAAVTGSSSAISIPHGSRTPSVTGATPVGSYSRSPSFPRHNRRSTDLSRTNLSGSAASAAAAAAAAAAARSRTPSRGPSPRVRSTSVSAESGDWIIGNAASGGGGGGRDESALYQAETQMLTRENQMLRHRIRELEKQLSDMSASPSSTSTPQVHSHLTQSSSIGEEGDKGTR
ncbi:hypothetical protein GMORB2_0485 [Geosmithia morbida]|uniref:Uncharacterized protein n=1 Tax=Geosmithia morbida TaxID=1094350 RepID=A0A9P4Z3U1_9HYPO|nr:uncharacterized protein GMORB2_0485 [Geosmithia morbida]KAF4126748.1 hypothetical protein GMORB2_0485 [Geosmithia morbida]